MLHNVWIAGFCAAIVLFQIVSVPALLLRKNDLADVLWGPAFPLCAAFAAQPPLDTRKIILLSLLIVWAVRLFAHVGWRNLSHRQEDVRYNNWRKQWGSTWVWRSYLQVFVLQALILFLFLLPSLFILASPERELGPLAYAGIALWFVGFFFEAVGDEQLRRFKRNPENKGKLMTTGL
jgi:steroid 5-alpha reductase family enzyme